MKKYMMHVAWLNKSFCIIASLEIGIAVLKLLYYTSYQPIVIHKIIDTISIFHVK